jgi:hypothetical protein
MVAPMDGTGLERALQEENCSPPALELRPPPEEDTMQPIPARGPTVPTSPLDQPPTILGREGGWEPPAQPASGPLFRAGHPARQPSQQRAEHLERRHEVRGALTGHRNAVPQP